ncbi:MAG: DNA alkylation repair protein [Candidatus Moranbacteria bacterium]|nr:DNA alkylation repair protein [Candidatus Moranbacteria bacterium]
MSASGIVNRLKSTGSPQKAKLLSGFFKTGKGQYGEGDVFLGVIVPEQRKIAKEFRELPFPEIEKLLASPYHEARLTGLLILTYAFEKADERKRESIYDFLLDHRVAMNNWDLVDAIVPKIVGEYMSTHRNERKILRIFSESDNLWERRIAVLATAAFIRRGQFKDTLSICTTLLRDEHDLIHKATGWMLREVGKRDEAVLRDFLDVHAFRMPRTMLRYAIERLPEEERKGYLNMPRIRPSCRGFSANGRRGGR